ncbi:MAG: hypothetical protein ABIJ21_05290 [Nanoarchaeota archaeon]
MGIFTAIGRKFSQYGDDSEAGKNGRDTSRVVLIEPEELETKQNYFVERLYELLRGACNDNEHFDNNFIPGAPEFRLDVALEKNPAGMLVRVYANDENNARDYLMVVDARINLFQRGSEFSVHYGKCKMRLVAPWPNPRFEYYQSLPDKTYNEKAKYEDNFVQMANDLVKFVKNFRYLSKGDEFIARQARESTHYG